MRYHKANVIHSDVDTDSGETVVGSKGERSVFSAQFSCELKMFLKVVYLKGKNKNLATQKTPKSRWLY